MRMMSFQDTILLSYFSQCLKFSLLLYLSSLTLFHHTEQVHVIPICPVHLPLTQKKTNSSLNHKTCTTIEIPPLPLPPPQTKKNQSSYQNNATAKELHIQVPIGQMAPRSRVPQEH